MAYFVELKRDQKTTVYSATRSTTSSTAGSIRADTVSRVVRVCCFVVMPPVVDDVDIDSNVQALRSTAT